MPADPTRPATKANSTNRRDWRYYGLALAALWLLAVPVVAQTCPLPGNKCTPAFNLSAFYGGQNISINTCPTNTTSGSTCAWADAVAVAKQAEAATYFLACSLQTTGPIALCYYSGMPGAPYSTPSCTISQGGNAAQCYCYDISNTQDPGGYSYVEMTAILNEDVYQQTVSMCGMDGSSCLNYSDIQKGPPYPTKLIAPACTAIQNKTLFPGADRISDFSTYLPNSNLPAAGTFQQNCGSTSPPPIQNPYAGCMTAPCTKTNKIDPATKLPLDLCTCPTFNGPNQVGNAQIKGPPSHSCSPTPYVWSSAYVEIAD